ncbi:MAG: flagellar biosynthesis protein FlhA, partial [Planctomycetota bacterium]|nr:flagellar biosynthesis protein FlhA [Planctomycetota bacterium]
LLPAAVLGLLVVLVVPLPAAILDLLLVANIAIASLMLINAITQRKALEFSSFPALLLGTTLLRLVLNIASTRLILGADASSPAAVGEVAGAVISGFGGFVAGGSLIVGFIIFAILVIVQFVVITKGATRMSEVTARFTLDAMPGKQMAIDADLSAGLIDEQEATRRREEITAEADFYGAMDGASKFVRGDAVAGLIITGINLAGGILVGVWLKGWTFAETASAFTRLTIGDGLAAQVPAFLIATAAGMLIARGGDEGTISDRIPEQLVARPKALLFISAFLGLLAMTPLPTVPLLAGALGLGFVAWAGRDAQVEAQRATEKATPQEAPASEAVTPERLAQISELQVDLGTALLGLAGADGPIVMGIGQQRNRIAAEFGLILPGVSVRDDQALRPREYRI